MDITQVKIFPVHEDKLKAFVSVVFDHCFMVNDIKVIQGKDGLFLSMPSRRKKSGEFKDVAHPLNNETRRMLEERVLAEYRESVGDVTPRRPDREDEPLGMGLGMPTPRPVTPSSPLPSSLAADAAHRPGRAAPAAPKSPGDPAAAEDDDKTLEEVQELHLRDSFWNVS